MIVQFLRVLKFSNMFRSIFDHPQGDIFFFTSVTKDKIIWFAVACLLYSLLHALPSLVVAVLSDGTATTRLRRTRNNINTKHNKYNRHATTNLISLSLVTEVKKKYLPEDGQKLNETCWRILRLLKQYDHFNVLF